MLPHFGGLWNWLTAAEYGAYIVYVQCYIPGVITLQSGSKPCNGKGEGGMRVISENKEVK